MTRWCLPIAMLVFAAGAAPATADVTEMLASLRGDKTMAARLSVCPADLYEKAKPVVRRGELPIPFCNEHNVECLAACLEHGDPQRCLALGLILENNLSNDIVQNDAETIYATACAMGMALGCTNRAAEIQAHDNARDPLAGMPARERTLCLARSFRDACEGDDPWGCTMLGAMYANGSGVARDPKEARRLFEKSCSLPLDQKEACENAKDGLKALQPHSVP